MNVPAHTVYPLSTSAYKHFRIMHMYTHVVLECPKMLWTLIAAGACDENISSAGLSNLIFPSLSRADCFGLPTGPFGHTVSNCVGWFAFSISSLSVFNCADSTFRYHSYCAASCSWSCCIRVVLSYRCRYQNTRGLLLYVYLSTLSSHKSRGPSQTKRARLCCIVLSRKWRAEYQVNGEG